jgi:hypothetical protein
MPIRDGIRDGGIRDADPGWGFGMLIRDGDRDRDRDSG